MDIIYNLLSLISGAFSGLPAWTRWIFFAFMIAGVLGLSFTLSPIVAGIVVAGLIVVALLVGGFWLIIKRARNKRGAAFGGDLQQQAGVVPGEIADPARRARLDDLKRNFEKGVETFRAAGKNLYDVPWYVIVGEPGAGKTEAIRHSNVGFPPGMQDEFQGVGGTINMNWWFTNDAVILDTAGRLLFEEVEPGTTGEWRVFLEMLKKHRVNCPINGLILAIPSESLIKDTPDQIKKKAGKIAQQLEIIQKQLDVRFPAYVVITKCDLLNGFREFFDDLTDPQAQQQMMGWSNPDPLDSAFRPELVDEHIYTVVQRLRRRRQGLMLDPVARSSERRADEVDRLFSLPHSVSLIAPNLQKYLETIFVAGAWSVHPLFLRGIYFTSSLREGSALDQELAEALGLDVEALPEGKAWERERAYFLRDLFIEKTFRERGLVTRATNTKKLVMKRRLTLLGSGVAGLLVLLGLSWAGYHSLKSSIGRQSGYWARASEDWTENIWNPIVQRASGASFQYRGDQPVGDGTTERTRLLFSDGKEPLTSFHTRLREFSVQPLNISMVFRPLARFGVGIDRDRKRAQRVVFEDGVIKPLADATRGKMSGGAVDPNANTEAARQHEADALLALIRLEAGVVKRRDKRAIGTFNGEKFLPPLFRYVSGDKFDTQFPRQLDTVYGEPGVWPPDWLSGGLSLGENRAIDVGLNRFIQDSRRITQSRIDGLPLIVKVLEELRAFARFENDLYAAAKTQGQLEKTDQAVLTAFNGLIDKKQTVDVAIAQAKKAGLFEGGPILLAGAYERLFRELRARYDTARSIEEQIEEMLTATKLTVVKEVVNAVVGERPEDTIFREIREKLKGVLTELESKFKGTLSDADLAELRTLDEFYLADPQSGALRYDTRWNLYDISVKASPALNYAQTLDLVGKDWKPLNDLLARVAQIRQELQGYQGSMREQALAICGYCLSRAERVHSDEFCKAYLVQAKNKLRAQARFPLIGLLSDMQNPLKPDDLVPAINLVENVKRDLESPAFVAIASGQKQPLVDFRKNLTKLDPVIKALVTPEKHLRLVTVYLMNRADQFRLSGQQIGMDAFKAIELRVGTIDHATPIKRGTVGRVSTDTAADLELAKFTLHESFHFHFYHTLGDSAVAADIPAPGDWTALRVLDERRARRIGDGRRWQFALPASAGKLIWLEFRFDEPLPEFDDWPTTSSLGLDALPPPRR